MDYSVLVVDDEKELAEYTAKYFNVSGIKSEYVLSADAAREFMKNNTCSLILLDINLGEESGFELCKEIRDNTDIPILFISARNTEDDMMLALNIGGDDYITKPYSLSVLLAKVKVILKRFEKYQDSITKKDGNDGSEIYLGKVTIDTQKGTISKDGVSIRLKAMEYKLLKYLINNKNRVIEKDEFFDKVWGTEYVGNVTLNVHIRHLREKIEDDPNNPQYIKTVWGVGYILELEDV